jgi:hypothetical protein
MATTGLVFGIATALLPLCAIPGLVFSTISLRRIRRQPWLSGKGRSIAGIVTSLALLPIGLAIAIPTFLAADHTTRSPAAAAPVASPLNTQAVLEQIGLQDSDAPSGYSVQLYPGGDQVTDQVTLDLCSGNFPSESLRVARYQVGLIDGTTSSEVMSTEAVGYDSPSATSEAFSELRAAQANCPTGFATSPVAGVPALKTVFGPPPDSGWPQVKGVGRLAFAATVSDQAGQTQTADAVYLRRGSVLLGVYFDGATVTVPVKGQTSMAGIVGMLEQRLAALPAADVG